MSTTEILLTLSPEDVTSIGYVKDDHVGVLTVNRALSRIKPRQVFGWHLSLWIECRDLDADHLPTELEQRVLQAFETELHRLLCADGHGIFAARLTHDGGREVIWRVHDSQRTQSILQDIIRDGLHPREFSVRLDHDPQWLQLEEHLSAIDPKPTGRPSAGGRARA